MLFYQFPEHFLLMYVHIYANVTVLALLKICILKMTNANIFNENMVALIKHSLHYIH